MQKLILKETQAPYQVALSDAPFTGEVVILEKNGRAVAAVVPIADYNAFQAWRATEERKEQMAQEEAAIAREHQAFQQMLPDLLAAYRDRVVAIYQGKVIAAGDDRMEVWQRARQQTNGAPVYVQTVSQPSKVYKMPHRKVVRHVEV